MVLALSAPLFAEGVLVHREYDGTPVSQVLFELSGLAGREVVIGDEVRGLVHAKLAGVSPFRAFTDIVRAHGLVVRDLSGLLVVGSRPSLATDRLPAFDALGPRFRDLKVSLSLEGVQLGKLLKLIGREVDLSWIVKPPVGARVSARVSARSLPQVVSALALVMGLTCEARPDAIVFFRPDPVPNSR